MTLKKILGAAFCAGMLGCANPPTDSELAASVVATNSCEQVFVNSASEIYATTVSDSGEVDLKFMGYLPSKDSGMNPFARVFKTLPSGSPSYYISYSKPIGDPKYSVLENRVYMPVDGRLVPTSERRSHGKTHETIDNIELQ